MANWLNPGKNASEIVRSALWEVSIDRLNDEASLGKIALLRKC